MEASGNAVSGKWSSAIKQRTGKVKKKKRLKEKMEILGATFCFPISVVHRKFEKTYLMVKKFIFRTAFTVFGFYVGSSCENY